MLALNSTTATQALITTYAKSAPNIISIEQIPITADTLIALTDTHVGLVQIATSTKPVQTVIITELVPSGNPGDSAPTTVTGATPVQDPCQGLIGQWGSHKINCNSMGGYKLS